MTLKSQLPNLAQGVSRQPASNKEYNRPRNQSNFVPHPVLGLMDRPPSEFIHYPGDELADPNAYWTVLEMREDEQYFLRVSEEGIRVWDVQGEEYYVNAPNGYGYLASRTGGNIITDPEDFTTVNWSGINETTATISGGSPVNSDYTEVTCTNPGNATSLNQGISGVTYVEDVVGSTRKMAASVYLKAPTDGAFSYVYTLSLLNGSFQGLGVQATLNTLGVWSAVSAGSALFQVDEVEAIDQGDGWCLIRIIATLEEGSIPAGNQGSLSAVTVQVSHVPNASATGNQLKFGLWGAFAIFSPQEAPDYIAPPSQSFETLSAKDFTFILNKDTQVEMTSDETDAEEVGVDADDEEFPMGDKRCWFWFRQPGFEARYTASGINTDSNGAQPDVEWIVGARTWNGSSQDTGLIRSSFTSNVAQQIAVGGVFYAIGYPISSLAQVQDFWEDRPVADRPTHISLDAIQDSTSQDVFDVNWFGSVIEFTNAFANNEFVEMPKLECDLGAGAVQAIIRQVESLSDLPTEGFHGKKIIVDSDPEIGSPVTYYQFEVEAPDTSNNNAGPGIWRECPGFGVRTTIDASTMPHGLTRKVDDSSGTVTGTAYQIYFEFDEIDWGDRTVGDDDSAPTPSFVSTLDANGAIDESRSIQHMFFYRNRLGFLSDDRVIMSETGEFFNFWRTTAEQLVTSDPIDVRVNSRKVRVLDDTFESQGRLFLRSEDVIFEVEDSDLPLSAETIQIRPRIDTHTDRLAEPVVLENTVLVTDRLQRFTQVSELFIVERDRLSAALITSEVTDFIVPRIQHITKSSSVGMICMVPEARDIQVPSPRLYMHSYFWSGRNKIQSAWWTIDFAENDTVRHAEFFEDTLYLVMERAGKVYFNKITFDMPKQESESWEILCDDRIPLSELDISESGGDSTITAPWPVDESYTYYIVFDGTTGGYDKGERVNPQDPGVDIVPDAANGEIVVEGVDITADSGFLGVRYNREFEFDEFRPKTQAPNSGRIALSNAEVTIHELILDYKNTIEFKVENGNRRTYTQTFTTYDGSGDPALETGTRRFPIHGDASRTSISIKNTSPRPSILTSGEIVYSLRARGRASSL